MHCSNSGSRSGNIRHRAEIAVRGGLAEQRKFGTLVAFSRFTVVYLSPADKYPMMF